MSTRKKTNKKPRGNAKVIRSSPATHPQSATPAVPPPLLAGQQEMRWRFSSIRRQQQALRRQGGRDGGG